jgi:hypothetical protein
VIIKSILFLVPGIVWDDPLKTNVIALMQREPIVENFAALNDAPNVWNMSKDVRKNGQ